MVSLASLAPELLLLLADRLHNIEDYSALSSTCTYLRTTLQSVTPNIILRLANNQSRVFFRPSPEFLAAATARQLGEWARLDPANEAALALAFQNGPAGMLDLALLHCGLTMSRIRQLHALRFSVINPVTDIIDQCVGQQWYSTPDFWYGGVDDAYTIDADPNSTFFHLAIYGELFAPDLAAYLDGDATHRALSVETRLEYIKYCVPDFACELQGRINPRDARLPNGELDPRRDVKPVGPYTRDEKNIGYLDPPKDNNIALVWVLRSTRWRPHWRSLRQRAAEDFQDGFEDEWWLDGGEGRDWRQRLWENTMVCQGLEGLGMIRPEMQDGWLERIRAWKAKIAALDRTPGEIKVGRHTTYDYPFLLGDLRICASGFVGGS
ncbi:unnamed protein product [Clonostachys rhizophaga]|uniref:Uncharacterized protein n=1 Tax=Clonostachys rhizophaga TaxID=160324 RepID=A0A9N9YMM4_9HYPO|nr:unnamed protein product [Clonostachys rhizophaga]